VNFGGISVGGMVLNRKMFGQGVEADHLPAHPTAGKRLLTRHAQERRVSWLTICCV
jgi:hypothetical protein